MLPQTRAITGTFQGNGPLAVHWHGPTYIVHASVDLYGDSFFLPTGMQMRMSAKY